MSSAPRAALLTGERGAGKTTICISLAADSPLYAGIVEVPIPGGAGRGPAIRARSLADGEEWDLASTDRDLGGPRTGRFSFSREGIDRAAAVLDAALSRPHGITVIDEVGPLELSSGAGFGPVLPRLAASGSVLITVRPGLLSLVMQRVPRHLVEVFRVEPDARGVVREKLRAFLEQE